ncbi:tetratricopeptide repeat protein [Okeanomitos corallinicola TIOX110]|uniref:Tetratricopeptide repeat protein n=1 Tax=Okeanomitos corallinicola TIOX110 TaxID=3133117 RepID=A0ABZ2UQX3_9CYAN
MLKFSKEMLMIYFWRLIFSFMIIFAMIFSSFDANSLALEQSEITASDWFRLGVNQMLQDNYQAAIKSLSLAIQQQNKYPAAYKNRCLAYLQIQDYHEAIADCSQALNLLPQDSEVYLHRGLAQYRQGNYVDAIKDYNQALAIKTDDFRVYYNRGIAFAAQGNFSQAITDYNQAISNIPKNNTDSNLILADIYNDRGLGYFELQNLSAAMENFNLAINLNSDDERAYFNRGCICGRSGDNMGAKYDFSQVIRLNPSHAQAYLNRGIANYNLGLYQRAIADLQIASEKFAQQKQTLAYHKTLELLKTLQTQISLAVKIV